MQPSIKPVTLVKASAGSGKTHQLTQYYKELLLGDGSKPDGSKSADSDRYKHILAVTFTNKATSEMKSRIIEALYACSQRPDDDDSKNAEAYLSRMLHDYSCFSVSTIDKFFQTVMRAFSRELGQYASYRVELDESAVIDQVVDSLLDSIADPANRDLLDWFRTYSFSLAERGKSWNIADPLKEMSRHFLDESFLIKMRLDSGILEDRNKIKAFAGKVNGMIGRFEQECRRIAQAVEELARRYDRGLDDFKWKKNGPMTVFRKWQKGDYAAPNVDRMDKAFDDFPAQAEMAALVGEAIRHHAAGWIDYNTAVLIRDNLHLLGIYADVLRGLQTYLKEHNVVLLRQSTDLLNRIIDRDDTPFVYEKIGNRYDHLLLDEAQDTSLLQWNNFKPLFLNSAAQGNSCLVVGDIKQSIYRWRGSDWHLLSDYLKNDLGEDAVQTETLSENWRSGSTIVDFNNEFFGQAGQMLAVLDPDREQIGAEIKDIYSDSHQDVPEKKKDKPQGYVQLTFFSREEGDPAGKDAWHEQALERMRTDIDRLLQKGYASKDITVLVRKKSEGAEVASYLIGHGISVLTEDSLQIGASPCISRLMAVLSRQVDPDDPVAQILTECLGAEAVVTESASLYETCERLLGEPALAHTEADLPFIYVFLDAVLAYQEKYGSSLRGFVKWWEESGRELSVCAPDGQDAVQVMTIHKSKGLTREAIIIPFVEEDFVREPIHQPTLWCETSGPFAELGLIPIKAREGLKNTRFAKAFEQELLLQHVDVINNWYVAFTRARSCMLLYAPRQRKKKGISDLLYAVFAPKMQDDGSCIFGQLSGPSSETEDKRLLDDPQGAFTRVAMSSDRLRLSLHGGDYFSQEENARQQGVEQHRQMAQVDADPELEARSGGRHWFDGTYRVLNEASIVAADGEIFRPDRVLVAPDGSRVVVIDYKFGKPRPDHRRQVRNYVSLLQQMGYPSVEGWLWYVPSSEVEQIC